MINIIEFYNKLDRGRLVPAYLRYLMKRGFPIKKIQDINVSANFERAKTDSSLARYYRLEKVIFKKHDDGDKDQAKPRNYDFDAIFVNFPEMFIPFVKDEYDRDISMIAPFLDILVEYLKGNDKPHNDFKESLDFLEFKPVKKKRKSRTG